MKIGIMTLAFRAERFIEKCMNQFRLKDIGVEFHHVIAIPQRSWHNDIPNDNTCDIVLKNSPDDVLVGEWESDADQRNDCLDVLRSEGCEWSLIVDADEFYTPDGVRALIHSLHGPGDVVTAPRMQVYWKNTNFRIVPDQPDNPIVAIKTDKRFYFSRLSHAGSRMQSHAELHHLSYVRTDMEMLAKIRAFEHYNEIVPRWYEDIWEKWNEGMKNLHPTHPPIFGQAVFNPAPESIKLPHIKS